MESEFERELAEATNAMTAARAAFAKMVAGMTDADLERARRGQWDVAQVLDHVVQSDGYYRRLIAQLREGAPPEPNEDVTTPSTCAEWAAALRTSCDAIVRAIEGVGEETFYHMGGPTHQQYSILSVLENVTLHDHEHGAQVERAIR